MTIIDIYSGFLGAGKTTLIKKMIKEAYAGQKIVLIENEFGQIGIDSGFLQEAGIQITEMNSGCICCSLVGDFGKALEQVIGEYAPDRIIIEPSGVGKLSDVVAAVEKVTNADVVLGCTAAVVDAGKVKVYMKNFGEFYNNQIETAGTIILSRTDMIPQEKLETAVELLRGHNAEAPIVTTPWSDLTGEQLMQTMEGKKSLAAALAELEHEHAHHHHHDEDEHHCCCGGHHDHEHEHHHHHDEDEHHCCCGGHHDHEHEHHHHHDEDEHHCCCGAHHDHDHEHHHHHDEDDHHCCCGGHHDHEHEHHHHHHEDEHHCCCGGHHDHEHEHHHHHHADEVFASWGVETAKKFTHEQIESALHCLDTGRYGIILRAKGIVAGVDGSWIHFDYVPGECNVRAGGADVTGKLCVIGAQMDETAVANLFGV